MNQKLDSLVHMNDVNHNLIEYGTLMAKESLTWHITPTCLYNGSVDVEHMMEISLSM